jgi:hypothetical protein
MEENQLVVQATDLKNFLKMSTKKFFFGFREATFSFLIAFGLSDWHGWLEVKAHRF